MTRHLLKLLLLSLALSACNEERTSRRLPRLEVPGPDGAERSRLDFGTVQVNLVHVRELRLRNAGANVLTISALTAAEPFGTSQSAPLTIGPGEELALGVTFHPTVPNRRVTGSITLVSDDPERPSITLELSGQGIAAVAVATPNPIDFGDVYAGESAQVTVTLSNAGTNALEVLDARLTAETPSSVSGDLSPLRSQIAAGASASATLSFAPTQKLDLAGALELQLDPLQGGVLSIPLQGRGVSSTPRVCFQFSGSGTESCSEASGATPSLSIRFPALCDAEVYADAGSATCAPGSSQHTGQLYLRNEGNQAVSYSMQYVSYPYTKDRCDAGYPARSDFEFSNAPSLADGGTPGTYTEATTQLAAAAESSKVTVRYTARSRCAEETTDVSRVIWTRQGEPLSHTPNSILVTFDGTSKLPEAVPADLSFGSSSQQIAVPLSLTFYGVNNIGPAPLEVYSVELWEELFSADGGNPSPGVGAVGPNGGLFLPCDAGTPGGDCGRFQWEGTDGGNPNQYAPHTLAAAPNQSTPTQTPLGRITFGPGGAGCDAGNCAVPYQLHRIYAVTRTNDPYPGTTISKIQGVAASN